MIKWTTFPYLSNLALILSEEETNNGSVVSILTNKGKTIRVFRDRHDISSEPESLTSKFIT